MRAAARSVSAVSKFVVNVSKAAAAGIGVAKFALPVEGEVDLAWNPVCGAGSYEVECKINDASSPFAPVKTVTGAKYTVTALTPGTVYAFRVRAVGAVGTGPWSDQDIRRFPQTASRHRYDIRPHETGGCLRDNRGGIAQSVYCSQGAHRRAASGGLWARDVGLDEQFQQLQRCHRPLLGCGADENWTAEIVLHAVSSASGQGFKFRVAGPGAGPAYCRESSK